MSELAPEQAHPSTREIAQRLTELQQQIAAACARAGRAASEVTFMAVSKTVESARIRAAIADGTFPAFRKNLLERWRGAEAVEPGV